MKDDSPLKSEAGRDYLTLAGQVDATKAFVHVLLRADWLKRLIYNATIDSHVPFEIGVEYRLAESTARREGLDPPNPPTPSETFPPVPDAQVLGKALTRLRAKHVAACVVAKAENKSLPKLRFRSARDVKRRRSSRRS